MSRHFVACDLGEERGRVMLGNLDQGNLTISEIRCFENLFKKDGKEVLLDIDRLFQDTLIGLREIGSYDEHVDGISCTSCAGTYLLFDSDASYIPPTYHRASPRSESGREKVLAKAPWGWEFIYAETGVYNIADSMLFQLGAENSSRLKRADHLMPLADGFNFLFSGVPAVEISSASATQLYNPVAKTWSELLLGVLRLAPKLLPSIVPAGTKLRSLRSEIAAATGLEGAQIVASCSDEYAAALAGLPTQDGEQWACLRLGRNAVIGTQLTEPVINERSRELQFTNTTGYQNSILFHKQMVGLWIMEECRRFWAAKELGLDDGMLAHLAASAPPLESLIDLDDERFATPDDIPLKIQAYCKESGQTVPRKPGPITRCILESLALYYRKTLHEMAALTKRTFTRLYLLGDSKNSLLNHFIADALQIPVVIVLADTTVIGNVIAQALALGHIKTLEVARQIVRQSFKTETISPHAAVWSSAQDRLMKFSETRFHRRT